ncbi:conjugative transposon protein TraN [Mucilaginibacter lacusdianchii]|uniref:conjugative transposon protein TraN n=1 Tax=Mucilaginibacter lacusdianchii TaxID=2684211 RepID=UPI00131B2784|nr:conjugative transposon protein TraN [Mucilaginibacter sp. JXJ CY 39]
MKKLILLFTALLGAVQILFAQNEGYRNLNNLPEIQLGAQADIHFISPEPIQYADISSHSILGDMPVNNLLRLKLIPDSVKRLADQTNLGVITIVGESFIAQYRLTYTVAINGSLPASITIQPDQCMPLDFPGITLTTPEMKRYALTILDKGGESAVRIAKAYGLSASLNHIYAIGDHLFLDIRFRNSTNLPYDIDELRFKIEDKKIVKATNVQSLEIKPEWQLYPKTGFKREYHNIYVFKKLTFPGNKILRVELTEKQISGRTLALPIKYKDLLAADPL